MELGAWRLSQLQTGGIIAIVTAGFHHQQAMKEVIPQAGSELWYLPSYSSDYSQIEYGWWVVRNWMRQSWDEFRNFRKWVDAACKEHPNVLA